MFLSFFTGSYMFSLYQAKRSDNEILRIGAAGSLTMLLGESAFYCIDAINMRSKVHQGENIGIRQLVREILQKEGLRGLYRGYSASYYSSICYGYMYFYLYKGLKMEMKEYIQPNSPGMFAAIYASASTIAEVLALLVYYPYELVKVRLLTKNHHYNYYSVSDAFYKILYKDSVFGLYRGLGTFFLTFLG